MPRFAFAIFTYHGLSGEQDVPGGLKSDTPRSPSPASSDAGPAGSPASLPAPLPRCCPRPPAASGQELPSAPAFLQRNPRVGPRPRRGARGRRAHVSLSATPFFLQGQSRLILPSAQSRLYFPLRFAFHSKAPAAFGSVSVPGGGARAAGGLRAGPGTSGGWRGAEGAEQERGQRGPRPPLSPLKTLRSPEVSLWSTPNALPTLPPRV